MSRPANSVWDFEVVKAHITDAEKDRILALYFNAELTNIDWSKAAVDLKSASAHSMRVSMSNMFKKLEKAGGKSGVAATDPTTPMKTPTTPMKTPTSGKKRKSKAEMEENGEVETPKSKKGRKTKKEIAAEAEGEVGVKEEQGEDEL